MLYQDPLYELSALVAQSGHKPPFSPGEEPPGVVLDKQVRTIPFSTTDSVQYKLERGGIKHVFAESRDQLIRSKPYRDIIAVAVEPLAIYRRAIARALVAMAIALQTKQEGVPQLAYDYATRDALITELLALLGDEERGIGEWISKQLLGMAQSFGAMDAVQRRRGAITDQVYPFAGDILVYQSHGPAIRAYINQQIEAANDSVVLLSHSLGGIACLDLLLEAPRSAVKLLITVGSQAPFFYEIGALQSLALNAPLPDHLPPWLNFFDLRDFLSYVGEKIFPGRITDIQLNGREPFPQAHSAYWFNPQLYDTAVEYIKRCL